jgi:dienelactone hydrolase
MTVARMLTQEEDGIPGYMAHPEGPGRRPGILMVHHAHGVTADYKIGVPGTNHIGAGADLQAKHSDPEFLGKMEEAWRYLIDRMQSDPERTGAIGHCMGGRLLIPFAADNRKLRAIVLYYPSVRDEPETSHRPRHAFPLARTLTCSSLVFCGGKDYIATPAIQGPLWESFTANGHLVEWHFFSDANHGFRHPDNAGFQPHYADLTWPLVTSFLQRTV